MWACLMLHTQVEMYVLLITYYGVTLHPIQRSILSQTGAWHEILYSEPLIIIKGYFSYFVSKAFSNLDIY